VKGDRRREEGAQGNPFQSGGIIQKRCVEGGIAGAEGNRASKGRGSAGSAKQEVARDLRPGKPRDPKPMERGKSREEARRGDRERDGRTTSQQEARKGESGENPPPLGKQRAGLVNRTKKRNRIPQTGR